MLQEFLKPRWGISVRPLLLGILVANFCVDLLSLTFSVWAFSRLFVFALQTAVIIPVFVLSAPPDDTTQRGWSLAEVTLLGVLGVAWLGLRIANLETLPYWHDEYTQLKGTLQDNRPVHMGWLQQQPPGSYILTHALGVFFGLSALTSKLLGMLPSAMAFGLFSLWARGVAGAAGLAAVGVFFAFDDSVLFHSLEGRGIGLALMWMGFLLLAGELALKGQRADLLCWGAGAFFFLMAVGLQPPLLLASVLLAAAGLGVVKKDRVARGLTLLTGAAFIAFAPIMAGILLFARNLGYLQLPAILQGPDLLANHDIFTSFFANPMMTAVLLLCCVLSLFGWRRRGGTAGWLLVFPIVLVPLLTVFAFENFINHLLQARYVDLWRFLLTAVALAFGMKFLRSVPGKLLLIAVLVVSFWWPRTPGQRHADKASPRQDWQRLYVTLAAAKFQGALFHVNGVCGPGDWCQDFFVGHDFDSVPAVVRGRLATSVKQDPTPFYKDNGLIDNALRGMKVRWGLVIPQMFQPRYEEVLAAESPIIEAQRDDKFIIVVAREESADPAPMLEEMNRILPDVVAYYHPLEILFRLYVARGQVDEARVTLGKWAKLAGHQEALKRSAAYRQKWDYVESLVTAN